MMQAAAMEPASAEPKKLIFNDIDITYDANIDLKKLYEASETSKRHAPVDLVWKDLNFSVPVKASKSKKPRSDGTEVVIQSAPSQKVILRNISGAVRSGQMLAVMGSSGAGKTSLLNLLAGRITTSKGAKASGEVFVNGKPRDYAEFKNIAAYVLQDDDMFGELTVTEQFAYAALLRLPPDMPRERKMLRVQKIITELGLSKVKDSMIGNNIIRGVSGGERKRVNIGTELVTDPSLIFLDEPTTGLDSFNALNVMSTLRQLASNGRTVVSTIHQPRSSIFALFDQLCLLSEGRVMYFGPARDATPYFASLNFNSPAQFNPADFFLDLLSVDPRSADKEANTVARVEFLGDKFAAQAEPLRVGPPEDLEANQFISPGENGLKKRDFQSNWMNEFAVLFNRSVKLNVREREANVARLGQVIFFSVLITLIWFSNGRTDEDDDPVEAFNDRQSLNGAIFFAIINQAFGGVFAVIFGFPLERSIVTRERAANTYRTSAYFLSKTLTDLPKTLFFNTIFVCLLYWTVGFKENGGAFFFFLLVIFLDALFAEALSVAVSVLTGDVQTAASIIPVLLILSILFGGFFIESDELPGYLEWGKYGSFAFYAFNAIAKNEFIGRPFEDRLIASFNDMSKWENAACLFAMVLVLRLVGFLFLHYLRGPKFLKF